MSNGTTTAIYVRVSTTEQNHASQLGDLERWVAAHEPQTVEWFRDKFTGTTQDRPEMNRLIDRLHAGVLDRIVCWRLDRLGRTAKGLCELFDDLQVHKVDLVSLRDGFSLNTSSGRLHARILASVAEFENELRRERQTAGIAAVRERNGGKCPWGGRKPGTTTIDYTRAIELRRRGLSIAEIASALSCSKSALYTTLRERGLVRTYSRQSRHSG